MSPRYLVLADDLTGALEAGALYASASIPAAVYVSEHLPEGISAEAVVVDIETRHAASGKASAIVARAITDARACGISRIYIKVDSTLRGPIAAQIKAIRAVRPELPVVFVPAYPNMGRAVRDGVLYVNGSPLSETAFAQDPLDPARTSRIADKLSECEAAVPISNPEELRLALAAGTAGVLVCDAATNDDLAQLASVIVENAAACICAGSAGLLAHLIRLDESALAKTGLIVNGSRHAASREQIVRSGLRVFEPGSSVTDVSRAIHTDGWAILSTGPNIQDRELVLEGIAAATAAVVRHAAVESLTIFGGDTAARILAKLGVHAIYPIRELLPGIPISRIVVDNRSMKLITKAGGFGGSDIIDRLRSALRTPE